MTTTTEDYVRSLADDELVDRRRQLRARIEAAAAEQGRRRTADGADELRRDRFELGLVRAELWWRESRGGPPC